MNNLDLTLLEINQIIGGGDNELKVFQKRGTKAVISDYAILSGGDFHKDGAKELDKRIGHYWTKTSHFDKGARAVYAMGLNHRYNANIRFIGVRPALPFSSFSNICKNLRKAPDEILEVEYGEYPQQAVSNELQKVLEELFQRQELIRTGKKYTRDKMSYKDYNQGFCAESQEEYEYQKRKYVRVRANSCYFCYIGKRFTLSNGNNYQDGEYVWVEVQPIKWLVDEEKNIAIIEKILFAGIQMKHTKEYKWGDFENSNLKWFMDTYFSKEIVVPSYENKTEENYQLASKIIEKGDITTQSDKHKRLRKVYTLK